MQGRLSRSSQCWRCSRSRAAQESTRALDSRFCPEPADGYEPCCWRAGGIIRSRCEDPGSALCEERVAAARADYLAAGVGAHNTVPGATLEDWGQCGQCSDCFLPAFNLRPSMSGQYALATGFAFGFIGSSDTHSARAGNGFKEHERRRLTEARGPLGAARHMAAEDSEPAPEGPVTHVILSHSHADHIDGTRFWVEEGTEIVAHQEFPEEQRYLGELQPYFWFRNRTLFPFMPEERLGAAPAA
jgi:hypothetical protein